MPGQTPIVVSACAAVSWQPFLVTLFLCRKNEIFVLTSGHFFFFFFFSLAEEPRNLCCWSLLTTKLSNQGWLIQSQKAHNSAQQDPTLATEVCSGLGLRIQTNPFLRVRLGMGQLRRLQNLNSQKWHLSLVVQGGWKFVSNLEFYAEVKVRPNLLSFSQSAMGTRNFQSWSAGICKYFSVSVPTIGTENKQLQVGGHM